MAKRKKTNNEVKIAEGVGLVALAAAAAGAFFLYSTKQGTKSRKKISSWMLKARGDVLEELEKAEHFNEKTYRQIVNVVAAKYKKFNHVDPVELEQLVKELKGHWRGIQKQVVSLSKPASRKKAPRKSIKSPIKASAKKKPVQRKR